jgi:hypothetical protein
MKASGTAMKVTASCAVTPKRMEVRVTMSVESLRNSRYGLGERTNARQKLAG